MPLMPVGIISAVWFTIGGAFDTAYLFRKLAKFQVNEHDGGMVYKSEK